jgi:SAM-dependent methyltransferase
MMAVAEKEAWAKGEAYEPYVGRWSRGVAEEFLAWLDVPPRQRWLDVGAGTGALTRVILGRARPESVIAIDQSAAYVSYARQFARGAHVTFLVGDAMSLQLESGRFDAVVSGLTLNFVPDPARALGEMIRVARRGGTVAVYLWDYADGMELMRYFWTAAGELDPAARELDEAVRFPIARLQPLLELFAAVGLKDRDCRAIDLPVLFQSFDDYWSPFLGAQGPAPGYATSLSENRRAALRDRLREMLPIRSDGTIPLVCRAWAVRGTKP